MRYSTEPRDLIYVQRYSFLYLAKNLDTSLNSKYGQKLLDTTENSKRQVQNFLKKGSPKNDRSNC